MRTTKFDSEQERQAESYNPSLRFDEKTTALFEDDNLDAEEYERVYHKRLLSPEQELAAAVLDEAVARIPALSYRPRQEKHETLRRG